MASSFMGLYVQRDALNIAQKSLDIVGNNISNIKTVGYTRQRVDVCSVGYAKGTLGYNNSIELSGRGAEAVGVAQLRDRLYDQHVRTYSGNLCNAGAKMDALSKIEDIFDSIEADTRDTDGKDLGVSFSSLVSKLKSALSSYSVDNADRSTMANTTLNAAKSLIECINKYYNDIDKVSATVVSDTKATVDRINEIFEELGGINKEIKNAYIAMGYITSDMNNYKVQNQYGPLELKDQFHVLLDELSQYGNIDVQEENDGTFTVKFAGNIVVKNKYYAQMAMSEFNPRPTELGFVLSSNDDNLDQFIPKKDAAGNIIDAYGYVDTEVDYRIRGLKSQDEWYKLHTAVGTGGDAQVLLRSDMYKGELLDITGGRSGRAIPQYLDSGSLRGLLDVYNGRGTFAEGDSGNYPVVAKQIEVANKALADLAAFNQNPGSFSYGEVEKLKDDIENAIGAKITKIIEQDGNGDDVEKYVVTVNNVEILSKDGDVKTLELKAKAGQDYATIIAKGADTTDADGNIVPGEEETLRTMYSNSYQGIEYYRDLLNSYVNTLTDHFNNAYTGFDVKVDTADYINSYAMQLAEYSKNPLESDLTRDDVAKIIKRLKMVDGVTVTPDTADGVETYTVEYKGTEVASPDGTFTKIDKEALPEDEQTTILKDFDYELLTYDKNFFRNAAENVRISDDWLNRPEIIADPTNDNEYEELLNVQINKLLGIFGTDLTIYADYDNDGNYDHTVKTEHAPEEFVDFICQDLGHRVSLEETIYETTDINLTQYEYLRSGVMDVSMEEEGVDMLNFQKWYSAISRMVSAMDELLDRLINHTGIVGLN
ncbi:MAG: hypothetical protein HDT25_07255 [Ruminococcus sp.]|nr:hypothetical protein [Ruminococcus sp.]